MLQTMDFMPNMMELMLTMMDFKLNMMDFMLKMMDFMLKMACQLLWAQCTGGFEGCDCAVKVPEFASTMMNFEITNDEFALK